MATTSYSLRIEEELKAGLEGKAAQLRVTLQQLIRWILEDAAQKPAVDLLPVPMVEAEQE